MTDFDRTAEPDRHRRLHRPDFLPFSPPQLGTEEIDEVIDTLRSDWITTGPKVEQFERSFADLVSTPAALAVSSCTDALLIALAALGVGSGDAVFVPTMTFCATANVAEQLGATPVFVDVLDSTLNMDPAKLAVAVCDVVARGDLRPAAIMPVHYAGNPCDMQQIDRIARGHRLHIVEDAAHALPASVQGRMIGDPAFDPDLVRATAFSFYATKNLTTGEGGMLTGPAEFLGEARLWSRHGIDRGTHQRTQSRDPWDYQVVRPGFKCNMTDVQASLGLQQLRKLHQHQRRRAEVVQVYDAYFAESPCVQTIARPAWMQPALHLYPVRLDLASTSLDRSEFIRELHRRNIGASVHFVPLHLQPFYRDKYDLRAEDYPVATAAYSELISLPLSPRMTADDARTVVQTVADMLADFGV